MNFKKMLDKKGYLIHVAILSAVLLPRLVVNADPDIDTFICTLDGFMKNAAFIGAIAGVMLFGLSKIIDVFVPDLASMTRDYIKKAAIGIVLLGFATTIVSVIFDAVGLSADTSWC